jgi:Fe-S cluster biogenesis protein NfuA
MKPARERLAAVEAAIAVAAVMAATTDSTLMNTSQTQNEPKSQHPDLLVLIERVLDLRVRPDLRADGGDIELVGVDADQIVQVRLTGACQGCSSSVITMTMRVEATLKAEIPEIRFVEAVL